MSPSLLNAMAYWLVNMLRAAFETLYAAQGVNEKTCVKVIEPRAEELWLVSSPVACMAGSMLAC